MNDTHLNIGIPFVLLSLLRGPRVADEATAEAVERLGVSSAGQ